MSLQLLNSPAALLVAVVVYVALAVLLSVWLARRIARRNFTAAAAAPEPETPLYDQLAEELGIRPEVPFSAGDETDIVQALEQARRLELLPGVELVPATGAVHFHGPLTPRDAIERALRALEPGDVK